MKQAHKNKLKKERQSSCGTAIRPEEDGCIKMESDDDAIAEHFLAKAETEYSTSNAMLGEIKGKKNTRPA